MKEKSDRKETLYKAFVTLLPSLFFLILAGIIYKKFGFGNCFYILLVLAIIAPVFVGGIYKVL